MISKKNFGIAGILSLLLVFFWQWRTGVVDKREAQRALYLDYISGPLTDYSLALTRSLPLLHGEKAPDLMDAQKYAGLCVAELSALLATAKLPSFTRENLDKALPLHQALVEQMGHWKNSKKQDWPRWRTAEEASRRKLIFILETLRYHASHEWRLTQSQQLEMNALIYSLKELSVKSPQ